MVEAEMVALAVCCPLIFASFEVWVYCVPARLKKVEKFWQERTCWTP